MSAKQKSSTVYSLTDGTRRSPRLSGVTVPRELLEKVIALAGTKRGALSGAVQEALEAWVAKRQRSNETKEKTR